MQCRVSLAITCFVAGCSIGPPPGFSGGESWALPLVGPLEGGVLVTPAMVNGRGPYLFAIDPDSSISAVDVDVVHEAQLWRGLGPHRIDETNTGRPRYYAEVLDLRLGNLAIDRLGAMVFPVGTYDTEGRHIQGIIGRNVLADSLVFGFDRDQGVVTLTTVASFHPQEGAPAIHYESTGRGAPAPRPPAWFTVPRRVAVAEIDGRRFTMHLDLGGPISQLAASKWRKAGLAPVAAHLRLSDEAAVTREVTRVGLARTVQLGAVTQRDIAFAPYVEDRFPIQDIDGALGLDFFRPFSVFVSWDSRTYYLRPRGDAAASTVARLGRWGAAIPACPHAGCVIAEITAGEAGATLHVVRDPAAAGHPLEVFLAATTGSVPAPVMVELPASADQVTGALPAEYAGAALTVLDASPFPRACPTPDGCVLPLQPPLLSRPVPAALRVAAAGQP